MTVSVPCRKNLYTDYTDSTELHGFHGTNHLTKAFPLTGGQSSGENPCESAPSVKSVYFFESLLQKCQEANTGYWLLNTGCFPCDFLRPETCQMEFVQTGDFGYSLGDSEQKIVHGKWVMVNGEWEIAHRKSVVVNGEQFIVNGK